MNVLFLLSSLEPAGSETYCLSLAAAWKARHDIFWISDQLHFDQTFESMPIHRKAVPFGIINTFRVASFIRRHKIEVIHSHSRRAHWVAAQAAALTGIAHVTTIHQPLPVHFFSRHFPCLGDETIAIDEAVFTHLRDHFKRRASRLHLIRNGIDLTLNAPSNRQAPNLRQILIIGRLSGGRWKTFQFFLETLERIGPSLPPAYYRIVGLIPNERRSALVNQLSILGSKIAPAKIETLGYIKDLPGLIRNADGAVAAGRSALECLAQCRPVVLLGEGGVLGLCKPEVWPAALRTNLGDHLTPADFNPARLEAGLRELLSPRVNQQDLNHWARAEIEKNFDIRAVAKQVEAVYQKALERRLS